MNSRVAVCLAVLLSFAPSLCGESADERYVEIYSWIEDGDRFLKDGQQGRAAEKYQEAQAGLKDLQKNNPGWNPKILSFRLDYVGQQLSQLAKHLAPPAAKAVTPAGPSDSTVASPQFQQLQEQVARLTSQNTLLEAKLREALSVQPAAADQRELARIEERLKQVQKERDLLSASIEEERARGGPSSSGRSDKLKQVEEQLAAAQASVKASQSAAKEALEERDALAKKLDKANKDLAKQNGRPPKGGERDSQRELESLQARLAVYEARPVPWTPEEQALIKSVPVTAPVSPAQAAAPTAAGPTNGAAGRKRYEVPAGAGALFAEAERAIDAGRFADAEKKLRDVLRQDEGNVRILAKLGAVLMDLNRIPDAEATLTKALSLDPEDAASLYLLGGIKLRQEKYDEALDLLSRSAKIEPDLAQTQFFLGRVLLQKGSRSPAETALRKAIQLKPGWGDPHYLLAVVYGTQEPTYRELARFHYKRAVAGGATRNPDLEKRIENGPTAAKQ